VRLEEATVQTRISASLDASVESIQSLRACAATIESVSAVVIATLRAGQKVLTAGNGGSAAESLHMAEELVGRFRGNRMSLPAVSLVADCTALTCIGNDFGFDHIFSRQVEGLGKEGDVLILFSTSGRAVNLTMALDVAKARGLKTVALLGRDGGALAGRADYEIVVPGTATERIQEAHQVLLHLILDEVEHAFAQVGDS
jgi:D-sedoheptulose 7-phosphate isomerase